MYKGFFEDVEYVMGLFFKPFEGCCPEDEEDEDKECGFGCDSMPCCKAEEDEEDDEDDEGKGCDSAPCCKEGGDDAGEDEGKKGSGGFLGPGPLTDIMKCMFDASDTDYDYED